MQILISILIIISNILIQIRIKPFESSNENQLNVKSELLQMTTMYAGLVYKTNWQYAFIRRDRSPFHWIIAPLILIPSL